MGDKIKLVRFMSDEEFERYLHGANMENHTNWKRDRAKRTGSVGYCFFPCDEEPERMLACLTGIATLEKVVIMETDTKNVRKTYGRYRDASKDQLTLYELLTNPEKQVPVRIRPEYCAERYNSKDFTPLKVGNVLDPFRRVIDWYWRVGYPVQLG